MLTYVEKNSSISLAQSRDCDGLGVFTVSRNTITLGNPPPPSLTTYCWKHYE